MDPWERVLVGGFAIFMAGGLVQAYRTGIMSHEDGPLDINDNPLAFALLVLANLFCIVILTWIAAGHELAALWRLIAPIAMWRP